MYILEREERSRDGDIGSVVEVLVSRHCSKNNALTESPLKTSNIPKPYSDVASSESGLEEMLSKASIMIKTAARLSNNPWYFSWFVFQ